MNQPLILIIEDEESLRRFLIPTLSGQQYQVLSAATAAEGLAMARTHNPDLVLLDLGLPDRDGMSVLKDLRAWSRKPVVILSARNQERDKVAALDQGADDYLAKPFGAAELLARIRVALRHTLSADVADPVICSGGLRIDLERREISQGGRPVKLTALEYRLLEALVRRQGKVATHSQLLSEVWGPGGEGNTHYLRIYMAMLRKKLEVDPTRPRHFITEPNVGYRLNLDASSD
ncbi:DNA-binding response regulator [Geothrix limicola]|uniref:DNA-binding response regulator n=1 Tax=Geothrix limicola TaxID=2927978 RepID=A0ABQ5QG94_9BACT|nr:response regulator [Geothrix limicola]GLH73867.1 DNA-binding response regulator [Geothrix limicola]